MVEIYGKDNIIEVVNFCNKKINEFVFDSKNNCFKLQLDCNYINATQKSLIVYKQTTSNIMEAFYMNTSGIPLYSTLYSKLEEMKKKEEEERDKSYFTKVKELISEYSK